jgi:flavin reductase (DIM6/NTAB) family NADH-FMN oxidoreductase RutF
MDIVPTALDQRDLYKLIIGCVVPRPIAWVSTVDAAGRRNLAPYSFFNAAGSNPPTLTIAINHTPARPDGRKDTLGNLLATGEFVVNMVSEELAAAMNETATDYPAELDEFVIAGLTPAPSRTVQAPRVGEAPVSFECTLHTTVPVGSGPGSTTIVVGIIRHIYVRDDLINERFHIDLARLRPVGRLSGNGYCTVRDTFELVRKPYEGNST